MQFPLKFHKAKLHIYDPKSPKQINKITNSYSSLYRFSSEPKNKPRSQHQRSRTESVPYHDQIFNDNSVKLSVWNLQSNRLEKKQKSNNKSPDVKIVPVQEKTYKIPSNYLTTLQIKKRLQKDHYMHKYIAKNINQIQVNKIQPQIPAKKIQSYKQSSNLLQITNFVRNWVSQRHLANDSKSTNAVQAHCRLTK